MGPRFRGDDEQSDAEAINRIISLCLRADRSYHLAEALGFGRDERRELRRRGGDRFGALLRHLLDDIRIPHRPHEGGIVIVGASGSTGRRCGDVTAMARTLPPWRNGCSEEYETKKKSTRPAERSIAAGAAPR